MKHGYTFAAFLYGLCALLTIALMTLCFLCSMFSPNEALEWVFLGGSIFGTAFLLVKASDIKMTINEYNVFNKKDDA